LGLEGNFRPLFLTNVTASDSVHLRLSKVLLRRSVLLRNAPVHHLYEFFNLRAHNFFAQGYFDYNAFKIWVIDASGLPHSTLHIYMGLGIQLLFCLLLGKRVSHPTPLYFVCFAELVNELRDMLYGAATIDSGYAIGFVRDWLHTITVPTLLFMLARYTNILGKPTLRDDYVH